MALTDIIFSNVVATADRGNSGTVQDTTTNQHALFSTLPEIGTVETGVVYGPQNSLTGTSAGAGGSTYYSYG